MGVHSTQSALPTTNLIKSPLATVRLRRAKARGCFLWDTVVSRAFKMMQEAPQTWRKLDGSPRLAQVIEGVKFKDGIEQPRVA
ncbi:MAG: hypothetical protein A2527_02415 [Candidatus Lambdaproteobacteria bacterium RIFOXYD2_FULL_50_16]|uniref:Uncharacterized protein n=1 Tax=Candidatus Lambdaproteobacteria bacterium RIFOXYD2_FULL_50_16 TaxID=1817772 RepID=A0A1F6GDZ5_9PROT|nr:MAG: hypothetical protein A2527_02415 [Candidatus Lambdaproteobacteria bacterium RIFOXYD2_FULL_50_16]